MGAGGRRSESADLLGNCSASSTPFGARQKLASWRCGAYTHVDCHPDGSSHGCAQLSSHKHVVGARLPACHHLLAACGAGSTGRGLGDLRRGLSSGPGAGRWHKTMLASRRGSTHSMHGTHRRRTQVEAAVVVVVWVERLQAPLGIPPLLCGRLKRDAAVEVKVHPVHLAPCR